MCVGRSWNGCKRPVVISERSCMGVKDPRYYPKRFCMSVKDLNACKDPRYYPKRFCTGVRDPRYYPKSFVWVLETCDVIRKVLLPKRKHTVMFIT